MVSEGYGILLNVANRCRRRIPMAALCRAIRRPLRCG